MIFKFTGNYGNPRQIATNIAVSTGKLAYYKELESADGTKQLLVYVPELTIGDMPTADQLALNMSYLGQNEAPFVAMP